MSIQVTTYGKIAGITGQQLAVTGLADTMALQYWLHAQFPALQQLTYHIAVNHKIIQGNAPLPPDAAVALLPPFSGG